MAGNAFKLKRTRYGETNILSRTKDVAIKKICCSITEV